MFCLLLCFILALGFLVIIVDVAQDLPLENFRYSDFLVRLFELPLSFTLVEFYERLGSELAKLLHKVVGEISGELNHSLYTICDG